MKQREQALLLLKKAAQAEALVDQVLNSEQVSDEVTPMPPTPIRRPIPTARFSSSAWRCCET